MSEERKIRQILQNNERLYQEAKTLKEELQRHIRDEVSGKLQRTRYRIGDLIVSVSSDHESDPLYGPYRGDSWRRRED